MFSTPVTHYQSYNKIHLMKNSSFLCNGIAVAKQKAYITCNLKVKQHSHGGKKSASQVFIPVSVLNDFYYCVNVPFKASVLQKSTETQNQTMSITEFVFNIK